MTSATPRSMYSSCCSPPDNRLLSLLPTIDMFEDQHNLRTNSRHLESTNVLSWKGSWGKNYMRSKTGRVCGLCLCECMCVCAFVCVCVSLDISTHMHSHKHGPHTSRLGTHVVFPPACQVCSRRKVPFQLSTNEDSKYLLRVRRLCESSSMSIVGRKQRLCVTTMDEVSLGCLAAGWLASILVYRPA